MMQGYTRPDLSDFKATLNWLPYIPFNLQAMHHGMTVALRNGSCCDRMEDFIS
jgi:hypothetical protein